MLSTEKYGLWAEFVTDPFAVVSVSNSMHCSWVEIGRTEIIMNHLGNFDSRGLPI
jgi:hypothetical protein